MAMDMICDCYSGRADTLVEYPGRYASGSHEQAAQKHCERFRHSSILGLPLATEYYPGSKLPLATRGVEPALLVPAIGLGRSRRLAVGKSPAQIDVQRAK